MTNGSVTKEVESLYFLKLSILTLFRMGFFGAAHRYGGGGGKKAPLPKICHTYPTIMKLGHSYTLSKEDPKNI